MSDGWNTVAMPAAASLPSPITRYASPITRFLGTVEYAGAYEAMRRFTAERGRDTPDELWVLEHPPVYTVGQAGRREHLPRGSSIPVVQVDRGGQITYHGPGQAVAYLLFDLRRRGFAVSSLVRRIEQAVIDLLALHGVQAARQPRAPGVYVAGAKVAALGLRVRRGCCYHGVALNVDMDLAPFAAIDPCGYPGLEVTQLADLGVALTPEQAAGELAEALVARLSRSAT